MEDSLSPIGLGAVIQIVLIYLSVVGSLVITLGVFPWKSIVHARKRDDLDPGARRAWIIATVIFGPFVSIFYAALGMGAQPSKALRILSVLFIAQLIGAWLWLGSVDRNARQMASQFIESGELVISRGSLPAETRGELESALRELRKEVQDTRWNEFEVRAKAVVLAQFIDDMTSDLELSADEAKEWLALYRERAGASTIGLQLSLLERKTSGM
jgi:hypothetical protein